MDSADISKAVVGSVSAIVAGYRDGCEFLFGLKDRRESRGNHVPSVDDRSSQDLGLSMARGQDVIRTQYERDFKRLGARFSTGDQIARDTLRDIHVHLQKNVILPLKTAWEQDIHVDFYSLQDASDESQDRSIMCLMQLHQRLLVSAPIDIISGVAYRQNNSAHVQTGAPRDINRRTEYGDHNISSGPDMNTGSRPMDKSAAPRREDRYEGTGSRFQHMNSVASDYVAPDRLRNNRYYEDRSQDRHREPVRRDAYLQNSYDDPYTRERQLSAPRPFAREHLFAESPTMGVERLSSIGTVSSIDSEDHPEYNPWASNGGAVSPLSSILEPISPIFNKDPLIPDALEIRRNRESQHTFHSRQTSATLWNSRRDSYGDPYEDKLHSKAWTPADNESDYSRDSNFINYFEEAASLKPLTRDISVAGSHGESRYESSPPRPRTSPSMSAAFSMHPGQKQPSPPMLALACSPPLPQIPAQHLPRMQSRPGLNRLPSMPGLHEGPPPTAPPSRPIPVPGPPRIPDRAPSRPSPSNMPLPIILPPPPPMPTDMPTLAPSLSRALSNVPPIVPSRGDLSPLTPITPMTPGTPQTPNRARAPTVDTFSSSYNSMAFSIRRASTSTQGSSGRRGAVPTPALHVVPAAGGIGQKALLPSEENKFAGFCKGAWRAQIGDKKKTYEERNRPGGIYSKLSTFYKCQKCNFEGRAIKPPGSKKSTPDTKVYGSNGILYRWEFLFKSHVHVKMPNQSTLDSSYGCVFCCAEGKGTPVFQGVASLLAHLQEHRNVLPEGEVVYRMGAVTGRSPDPDEEFDVALPAFLI